MVFGSAVLTGGVSASDEYSALMHSHGLFINSEIPSVMAEAIKKRFADVWVVCIR